jgi:serine/threonine-protein kinase
MSAGSKGVSGLAAFLGRQARRLRPLPGRIVRGRWLRHAVLAALGGLCGVLLFHFFVMPKIVRLGQEARVPDLRGLPADEVEPLLVDERLRLGSIAEAHDDHIPIGHILRHAPTPGFQVKQERAVDLVVSLGPEALRVPALEGESLVHARFLLLQAGLQAGRISQVHCHEVPVNHVLAASPRPGTPLRGQATVDLLVSLGPPRQLYLMPDLRGSDAVRTEARLRAAGFEVGRRRWPGNARQAVVVADQTPPPGYPIERGGTVELLAGR